MPAEWPALAASSNRKPLEFGVPARLGRAAEQGGAAMGFAVVGGLRIRRNPPGEGWGIIFALYVRVRRRYALLRPGRAKRAGMTGERRCRHSASAPSPAASSQAAVAQPAAKDTAKAGHSSAASCRPAPHTRRGAGRDVSAPQHEAASVSAAAAASAGATSLSASNVKSADAAATAAAAGSVAASSSRGRSESSDISADSKGQSHKSSSQSKKKCFWANPENLFIPDRVLSEGACGNPFLTEISTKTFP